MLGDISTGASNDIERATKIATSMVTKYGMSKKLGPICYGSDNNEIFIGRDMGHVKNYSEKTASEIDNEVRLLIKESYEKAEKILKEHQQQLVSVANYLFENEKMTGEDFLKFMSENN